MKPRWIVPFVGGTLSFVPIVASQAVACPVCDSGTGREVRVGILDGEFGWNLCAVLLPFPVLIGTVAVIHFGGGPRRGSRSASATKQGENGNGD